MTQKTYTLTKSQTIFVAPNDGSQSVVHVDGNTHHITTWNQRDWIYGGDSDITAYMNGGDDIVQLQAGNATIYGGTGDDWVIIGRYDAAERTYVSGGDGNDDIEIDADTATAYGGIGNDTLDVSADTATLYGGDNEDTLDFYGDYGKLYGGSGDDWATIIGDGYVDMGSGNDQLHIGLGTDSGGFDSYSVRALGGEGDDHFTIQTQVAYWGHTVTLEGGVGNDTYHGVGNSSHTMSIVEGANAGIDTVYVLLGASHTLGANIENMRIDETVYVSNNRIGDWETPSGGGLLQGNGLNNHMRGSSRGQELRGHGGNDTILGQGGNDIIKGGANDDTLNGEDGTDTLYGEDGKDSMTVSGADRAYGGQGDDTYTVDSAGAMIVEEDEGGHDTVISNAGHYTLGIFFEELRLASNTSFQSGDGTYLDNSITGGGASNLIRALAGKDTVYGGSGFDTIYGGQGNDNLRGDWGNDLLFGDENDDILNGGQGNDLLIGGDGIDFLIGDAGNDTLEGGNGDDLLSGGADRDVLRGNDGRDLLYGGSANDMLYGGALNDSLRGDDGDDVLDGGTGVDDLQGGLGNDRYYVDTVFDLIGESGGGGIDEVRTYLQSYTLGANIENLSTFYYGGFHGYGNMLNNVIEGEDGNDQLFGGGGNDVLLGGYGDDYILGGDNDDVLNGGHGSDRLYGGGGNNTASYAYDSLGVQVELLTGTMGGGATGDQIFGITNLTGSGFDDTLSGNTLANTLVGGAGNDTLRGRSGDDVLDGGAGNDVLVGGVGKDTFLFLGDFAAGGRDRITDFDVATDSLVLLPGLENLRVASMSSGAELRFDVDGGMHAIRFEGVTKAELTSVFDFV